MISREFEEFNFYRNPRDNRSWYVYVYKIPRNLLRGPYIGKYGEDDNVAYLGAFVESTVGWEKASTKEKAFSDIGRFIIKELFSR